MGTTAAILSCGRSLGLYPGPAGFDLIIGVNRAATAHRCNWWSCGDSETFGRYAPAMDAWPKLWTHHETYRRIVGHHGWVDGRVYERDECGARWSLFSATAAIELARRLGAGRIECFGCDMAGELNFDGTPELAANRTAERWALERRIWDETVAALNGAGIEVLRRCQS